MWNVEDLFVLSDLHLAAERNAGLFQSDAGLAACLRWILTDTRDSLTVLAGDVLDFLILTNGRAKIDFAHLGDHTREIIEHHPEVFEALSELARSPRHQLVLMSGDHDSELIFPSVRETIELRLGGNFINPPVRWLVHGEALRLRVGEAVALIEHGNVLDPWNRTDHAALQRAFALDSRNLPGGDDYQPPLGRRLVLEVLNQLRGSYHWIDCLKPETEAVLPLLWHFASRQQQKLIISLAEDYLSIRDFALNKKIGNAPNPERLYEGEKEAENSTQDKAFKDWYDEIKDQQSQTPVAVKGEDKLIRKLRPVSARDTFFELERPGDTVKYLRPIFEGGTDLVIHGHTHSAKACAVDGGFYLNTGTWGQVLRLPRRDDGDRAWQDFLNLLRKNDAECLRCPTLARVRRDPRQGVTTTALLEWQQHGPKTLATRRFSDSQSGWQKDG
jgi:UDP-2,3-diacylglucosamine pyrophosphatase LpxH